MQLLIRIVLLLGLATPVGAVQAPAAFIFGSTQGQAYFTAAGWIDADRMWFVASVQGADDLPYTGTQCPTTTSASPVACTVWGVVDVRAGRLLSLNAADAFQSVRAALNGGRLFIAGRTLKTRPSAASSPIEDPGTNSYLLVVDPERDVLNGIYLPQDFNPFEVVPVGEDLVLLGYTHCPQCTESRLTRIIRVDAALTSMRYDRTGIGNWYSFGHVTDGAGRIHFATFDRGLPTTPDVIFPTHTPSAGALGKREGGVVVIDSHTGDLVYATYLKMSGRAILEWDPRRQVVWLFGDTLDRLYPLSPDAVDTTFCVGAECVSSGCVILTGTSCNYAQESVLGYLQPDGSRFAYATFVGTGLSDNAVAAFANEDGGVTTLQHAGHLGSTMGGSDSGPRVTSRIFPELQIMEPPRATPAASWSSGAYLVARDRLHGDLYTRNGATRAPPGATEIQLSPPCSRASFSQFGKCFSIVWLPSFGGEVPAPTAIPGPGIISLVMLVLAMLFGGAMWQIGPARPAGARHRPRSAPL